MVTTRRINWKAKQAKVSNLCGAIELCVEYAREKHNRSVERIAELMGISSHWTLYKYMESGKLPANLIAPFEFACGCSFVSEFLVVRSGKVVITIPQGKKASEKDINTLQHNFTTALTALIEFYNGSHNEQETIGYINQVLSSLAAQRENIPLYSSPELGLFGGEE